ncbi:MAG TPA: ATP-grasp domain-containing protein [Mycobacteriales bacterium]
MTATLAGTRTARRRRHPVGSGALVIGGDYQGLGIARSLGRHGIPVSVLDDERSIARGSRYVQHTVRVPDLRGEPETVAALASARERLGLDGWVLYPTRDETVAVLARHRRELSRWFRVPTPDWPAVRACWDKRETYAVAERLGIPHPLTWVPADESDLAAAAGSEPLVIKPAIKEHFIYATRAKAWRADTTAELRDRFRSAVEVTGPGEVLVQELVPGGGSEQYSYCALVRDGRALASMTVRRRRQHPSDFGRASTYVETVELPELEAPSLRWLAEVGFSGLVEVEYKRDPRDGRFKLLDVNARTWGYHSLGAAAGVDFPYLLFRAETGDPPAGSEPVRARPGVRWIRLLTDVPNAARDLRRGDLRLRDYLGSLRGVDTEAVFSRTDPVPGLYELALLPYLALRRGL